MGQRDKVGRLADLPKWTPKLLVDRSAADFWVRVNTSPAGKAYGDFIFAMLDLDDEARPTIGAVSEKWGASPDCKRF